MSGDEPGTFPLWVPLFLEGLERTRGNVRLSAELAGRHAAQVYRLKAESPAFATQMESVLARVRALLLAECRSKFTRKALAFGI